MVKDQLKLQPSVFFSYNPSMSVLETYSCAFMYPNSHVHVHVHVCADNYNSRVDIQRSERVLP